MLPIASSLRPTNVATYQSRSGPYVHTCPSKRHTQLCCDVPSSTSTAASAAKRLEHRGHRRRLVATSAFGFGSPSVRDLWGEWHAWHLMALHYMQIHHASCTLPPTRSMSHMQADAPWPCVHQPMQHHASSHAQQAGVMRDTWTFEQPPTSQHPHPMSS